MLAATCGTIHKLNQGHEGFSKVDVWIEAKNQTQIRIQDKERDVSPERENEMTRNNV